MSKDVKLFIPIKELNEVCALPNRKWSCETHFNLETRKWLREVFTYKKFEDDFADTIVCVTDSNDKDFIGSFKPSYEVFLSHIMEDLNYENKERLRDGKELTNALLERVRFLSTLPNEYWLTNTSNFPFKVEAFPKLYELLQKGRKYHKEIEELKKQPVYKEIAREENDYYYSCGLRDSFDDFIPKQVRIYGDFVTDRDKYRKLIEDKDYDDFIANNYDIDRLAMYLSHKYLTVCEENPRKKSILIKYHRLLSQYIESSYDKSISIVVGNNRVDYESIVTRVNWLREKLNKIDGEVTWPLIPEGRTKKYMPKGLGGMPHVLTQEQLEALKEAGEEKENFYLDNLPLLKVYGLLKHSGYVGYIYPNGEVLLDTEYDDEYPLRATGNAIYHMKSIYFDVVSRLDKTTLKNHPAVDRIVHAGNWQKRAQAIINREGTEEEKEQAKQLVKHIMEQTEKNS